MDQIAPAIKWIKKNIFWLGCAFLSIAMVAIWFVASGSIASETSKNQRDVESKITQAQGIMQVTAAGVGEGVVAHPNATSEQGMKEELSKTIDSIVEAWTLRKKAQEKILVWPKVIPNETFVRVFGQFNPAETFPEKWEKGYGFESLLTLYASRIPQQMNYLCGDEVLRTHWNFDPANIDGVTTQFGDPDDEEDYEDEDDFGGGYGGGRGGLADGSTPAFDQNKYAVIWSDLNQTLWNQKLTIFQGRDDNYRETNAPTPLQCYMLQQDLWLLEAMFRIIREVNGNSNANDLSVIKRIDHVVFGQEVGGKLGALTAPDQRLAGMSPTEGMEGQMMDDEDWEDFEDDEEYEEDFMDGDYDDRLGGLGGAPAGMVPYDMRYVDLNFEPLSAEVVKAVITGAELPENNLELIVAKRVPVRIALRMDERRIADFMAACANSPFAFEIQQVRWNKHQPGGESIPLGGAGAIVSGGRGGGGGGVGFAESIGRGGGMRGQFGAANLEAEPVETRTNYDVNVEFYGIVKIYNPVREKFLRKAAGLDDELIDPNDAASPRP